MAFTFSKRSLSRLVGVDQRLVDVVRYAITVTKIDFAVTEGVRSLARQRELVASGASETMDSRHLTGHAVDLMAYLGNRASWELNLYDDIANAMKEGATQIGIPIRWGAAWHIRDIRQWNDSMEQAMMSYVDRRRAQGRRPFIDGPHFEIPA